MKLNSIIFHTTRLDEVREFYEGKLQFSTGIFQKDGLEMPDFSDTYVNYHLDGMLLCFEKADHGASEKGTIVVTVPGLADFRKKVEGVGIEIEQASAHFFKIKYPDGRTLIFEPAN